jgi:hypothetical protein
LIAVLEEIDETLMALVELPNRERGKPLKVREVDTVGPSERAERGGLYYDRNKNIKSVLSTNLQSSLERSRAVRRQDPPLEISAGGGGSERRP